MKVKDYIEIIKVISGEENAEEDIVNGILELFPDIQYYKALMIVRDFINNVKKPIDVQDDKLKISGKELHLIDPNDLKVGGFVDAMTFSDNIDSYNRLMSVMYRDSSSLYKGSKVYSEYMLGVDYKWLIHCLNIFNQFKKDIADKYTNIFSKPSGDKRSNLNSSSQFYERWSWYTFLYKAADGKFLNINKVLDRPVHEFLTFLDFEIGKEKIEVQRIKSRHK